MKKRQVQVAMFGCFVGWLIGASEVPGDTLLIGCSSTDITPSKPVALDGQFQTRISRGADNPVTATTVAIEARDGDRTVDYAILVSCDLVASRPPINTLLRDKLRQKLPDLDPRKVILTATHTHTGPVTEEGKYQIPEKGVMQPSEYTAFLTDRLVEDIARAWGQREPGGVSWVLGHAVVGHNRRAVYADGKAQMYGSTTTPNFRGIEGGEDHGLEMLFFWNKEDKPVAVCINVECPSQEVEGLSKINADFWHDVRKQLHDSLGKDICVLAWPGAAGDISPHRMYRKAAEERMLKLRNLTYTQEIGRRIATETIDVCELAKRDIRKDVRLVHQIADLALPVRRVTEKEMSEAKTQAEALKKKGDTGMKGKWYQRVIDRYDKQDQEPTFPVEVHVLRIGDIAIATNPFELFHDYGVQIKSRSKAIQTFVVQLTCGSGGYLPTKRAIEGGGYSAVVESNRVGHEGGQVLVEETLKAINKLFP